MKTPRLCDEWEPDPDIPPDHRGRETCRNCHRTGGPDDAGHTPPPSPPVPRSRTSPALTAAAQARDAAILGEHDQED